VCCLQVIEMTQVTPASDIWSVGCLIIELLTGYPPYYDLQPMSALFRIVQVTAATAATSTADVVHYLSKASGDLQILRLHLNCLPGAGRAPVFAVVLDDTACSYLLMLKLVLLLLQDGHPPLPDSVSPLLDDFLLQCFQKVGLALAAAFISDGVQAQLITH
jgi:serine/threonine protein kinase